MVAPFLTRPSPGRVTAPFGAPPATPTSPARHLGTDYSWGNGEIVHAAADGVVARTAYAGAYGNRTIIDHGRREGQRVETWYCHQSQFWVAEGDTVKRGQAIGLQGSTGNVTGKHLHHELRIDGVAVDSEKYLISTASPAVGGTVEIIMSWTPAQQAQIDWLVDATEARPEQGGKGPRTSPLAAMIQRMRDHVMPQVTALWSWANGWKFGEGTSAQDSPLRRVLESLDNSLSNGGRVATVADLDRLGAPTVTVRADASVFVEAMKDPGVAAALAPTLARAVADEIDRRNHVTRA